MMYDEWNGGASWVAMTLMMGLFWVVVVGAVIWAIRQRPTETASIPPEVPPTPAQILATRFAKGEITEEQYKRQLIVLNEHIRS